MNPFLWILWAIVAIPVLLIIAAVIVSTVEAVSKARRKTDARAEIAAILAEREALSARRDKAIVELRERIVADSKPPRYGVRTHTPVEQAIDDLLKRKDG